jgi:hypothetical protein
MRGTELTLLELLLPKYRLKDCIYRILKKCLKTYNSIHLRFSCIDYMSNVYLTLILSRCVSLIKKSPLCPAAFYSVDLGYPWAVALTSMSAPALLKYAFELTPGI